MPMILGTAEVRIESVATMGPIVLGTPGPAKVVIRNCLITARPYPTTPLIDVTGGRLG